MVMAMYAVRGGKCVAQMASLNNIDIEWCHSDACALLLPAIKVE